MFGLPVLWVAWWLCLVSMSSTLPAMASAKAAQGNFDVSERRCSDEHGLGSAEHEAALDRLDGKRIVFIGDVSVRWDCLAGLMLAPEFLYILSQACEAHRCIWCRCDSFLVWALRRCLNHAAVQVPVP